MQSKKYFQNRKRIYYLGLDIGTDSVGYAVADRLYNLLKYQGEPAWGVHLFDAAQLCAKRRAFRTARRRLDRRQQRVKWVQELFAKEISKVDLRFFIREQESALFREEAQDAFTLFADQHYTDVDYYRDYPTIHHLIVDLMKPEKPHDVRLVYLACAWLVAHRGHFLSEVAKENVGDITDFERVYQAFKTYFTDQGYILPWKEEDAPKIGEVLKKQCSLTEKNKEMARACFGGKIPKEIREDFPYHCETLFKCLCGNKVSVEKLFGKAEYKQIGSFSLEDDENALANVMEQLGDDTDLIVAMKALYDWALLVDILRKKRTISEAKVEVYEQHQADLKALKAFVRKYAKEQYHTLFRGKGPSSYDVYVGHAGQKEKTDKKESKKEVFYKALRASLKDVKPDAEDQKFFDDMNQRIETRRFG